MYENALYKPWTEAETIFRFGSTFQNQEYFPSNKTLEPVFALIGSDSLDFRKIN